MRKFLSNESGASLVEYGLLVGLIAVASIAAVTTLGEKISAVFDAVSDKLNNVANDVAAL